MVIAKSFMLLKRRVSYGFLPLYHSPKNIVSLVYKYAAQALSEMSAVAFLPFNSAFSLKPPRSGTNAPPESVTFTAGRCEASIHERRMSKINVFVFSSFFRECALFVLPAVIGNRGGA